MRRIVIGDIHGCAKALRSLIDAIDPQSDDELIFLGDYVDRGPNSRDVVQQLIALQEVCRVVPLLGNHEIMMLGVALRGFDDETWIRSGGQATITSYGGSLAKVPPAHIEFLQRLRPYHETDDEIFVHAGYQPDRDMCEQDEALLYWTHLPCPPPAPHRSGKCVFVGHTPQPGGDIYHAGHLVCIDTYCFGGGYLTALNVDTFEIIQCDRHGHMRRTPLSRLWEALLRIRLRWSRSRPLE